MTATVSPTSVAKLVRPAAPFVVSAVVVIAFAARAPRPALGDVHVGALAVSTAVLFAAAVVLCGLRWRLFLPAEWTATRAVRRYAEALFMGLFVPLGSDVQRALGGRAEAEATVADRLIAGSVTVVVASLAALTADASWPIPFVSAQVAGVGAAVAGIGLGVTAMHRGRVDRLRLAAAVGMTLGYIALAAVTVWLTGLAVGTSLPASAVMLVTPAVLLGAAVPNVFGLSPGAAAVSWLLPASASAATVTPGQAAAIATLLIVELWVAGAIGGLLLARRRLWSR